MALKEEIQLFVCSRLRFGALQGLTDVALGFRLTLDLLKANHHPSYYACTSTPSATRASSGTDPCINPEEPCRIGRLPMSNPRPKI